MGPRAGAENLVHTRIRYPDRPAHSESLYRLSYPGPHTLSTNTARRVASSEQHFILRLFQAAPQITGEEMFRASCTIFDSKKTRRGRANG
jgi:hypothetical protein